MDDYKKLLLKMLLYLKDFCEKHDIKFMLKDGTLLGAIRHNGFIPWDDDVDVLMDKDNYEKFLKCSNEYSSDYLIIKPFDDSRLACPRLTKIYFKNSCIKEYSVPYFEGAFIDVFSIIDLKYKSKKLNSLYQAKYRYYCRLYEIKTRRYDITNSKFIYKLFYLHSKMFSLKRLKKKICRYTSYKNDSNYCGSSFGGKNTYLKTWFMECELHLFENNYFYVPKDYDILLKTIYGNYMQLPKENQRKGHHLEYLNLDESFEEKNKNYNL